MKGRASIVRFPADHVGEIALRPKIISRGVGAVR